jgi:hypothetical protein
MGDPLSKVVYFFQAVEIVGMEMATDFPSTFEEQSCIKMVGYDLVNIFTKSFKLCYFLCKNQTLQYRARGQALSLAK